MHRGHARNCAPHVVGGYRHVVHLGQLGDAADFNSTAAVGNVWLQQVAGLLFHQLAEHLGSVKNLAGADRRLGLLADLGQGGDIAPLPANGILQPQQVEVLHVFADAQGVGEVEGTVQVDG